MEITALVWSSLDCQYKFSVASGNRDKIIILEFTRLATITGIASGNETIYRIKNSNKKHDLIAVSKNLNSKDAENPKLACKI